MIAAKLTLGTKAIALTVASATILTGSLVAASAWAGPQASKKQTSKKPPLKTGTAPAAAASPQLTLGKKVYADNGCGACHAISGKGGAAGPDLTTTGADPKHTPQWFAVQIATPKAHTPSSTMPEFPKIKGAELAALSAYLVSLKGATASPAAAVAKPDPAAVAKIEKFGGSVRELAQNDPHLEVDYHMQGASVTDTALVPLATMKSVVQLNLGKTSVTDAGLVHIKGLTNLAELHLEGTKITDRGLVNLAGLKNLTYLNLYGDDITDAGLEHLKGLTNLKNLYVWQTKVTQAGVDKLKTSIPKLDVVMGYDVPAAPAKK